MTPEEILSNNIYNYPTLFLLKDLKESRMQAAHHILVHFGTGYEWEGGCPFNVCNRRNRGLSTKKTLPQWFFGSKPVYAIWFEKNDKINKKPLADLKEYVLRDEELIFASDVNPQEIEQLVKKLFPRNLNHRYAFAMKEKIDFSEITHEYSPMHEVLSGEITFNEEWMKLALELAEFSIKWFSTPKLYKVSCYEHKQAGAKKQVEFYKEFINKFKVQTCPV